MWKIRMNFKIVKTIKIPTAIRINSFLEFWKYFPRFTKSATPALHETHEGTLPSLHKRFRGPCSNVPLPQLSRVPLSAVSHISELLVVG